MHDTGFHAGPYSGIRSAVDNAEPALPVESFQAQFESAKRFGALAGPGRGTFRDRFEDIKKRAFLKTGQLQGATGKLIRLTRRQQQAVVENPALLAEFHGRRPRRAIAFAAGPASPVAFDFSGIRSLTHALARQHHCMDRLEYYIGICDRHLPGQEVRSRLNQMFAAYNNADSSHREALIEKNSRFDPLRNRFLKDPETLALLTARVDLIAQYFGEHDVARPSHEHVAKQARTLRIQLSRLGQIERLFARIKETYEECRTVFYPRIDLRLSKSENFLSQLVFLMRQIKKHEPLLHKANRADRQSLIDLQRDLDIAIRHPSLYASLKRKWLAPKPSETLPDAAELLHAGGEGIRF